jgi:CotS family spore coat protein
MVSTNNHFDELETVFNSYHIPSRYLPHRNVYFTPLQDPAYVLKPLKVGAIRAYLTGKLLAEHELYEGIPHLIKPESGAYYLWRYGNRYLMTKKFPGRIADYHSIMDLKAAIIAMSGFHRFSRKVLEANPRQWAMLQFNPQLTWRKCIEEMETCREMAIRLRNDSFSRQYLQIWHCFYEMAFQVLQVLPSVRTAETQKTICYHDWAFHNVIIESGKAYLIDFDDMIVDHPIHDRVNLISRYLRLHHWSTHALFKALWNFDRFYHWQNGDLKLLRLYLTFPYEYWILGRQYYIEKQPWSRRYFQEQWQRKINYYNERRKVLSLIENME